MEKDEKKGRRGGRSAIPENLLRTHCVSVRMNSAELGRLDKARGKTQRGEWMRLAGLDRLPPIVPDLNREAWGDLGRLGSNLARILAAVEAGKLTQVGDGLRELVAETQAQIKGLRAELLGKK